MRTTRMVDDPAACGTLRCQRARIVCGQLGHLQAMAVWILVFWATSAQLTWQLAGAAAVLLLGPPILNGIARTALPLGDDDACKSDGGLDRKSVV